MRTIFLRALLSGTKESVEKVQAELTGQPSGIPPEVFPLKELPSNKKALEEMVRKYQYGLPFELTSEKFWTPDFTFLHPENIKIPAIPFASLELRYSAESGLGLFATQDIRVNSYVFYGLRQTEEEERQEKFHAFNPFVLSYESGGSFFKSSALNSGGVSRFVNSAPRDLHDLQKTYKDTQKRIIEKAAVGNMARIFVNPYFFLYTTRAIKAGEQLLVDYGEEYEVFQVIRFGSQAASMLFDKQTGKVIPYDSNNPPLSFVYVVKDEGVAVLSQQDFAAVWLDKPEAFNAWAALDSFFMKTVLRQADWEKVFSVVMKRSLDEECKSWPVLPVCSIPLGAGIKEQLYSNAENAYKKAKDNREDAAEYDRAIALWNFLLIRLVVEDPKKRNLEEIHTCMWNLANAIANSITPFPDKYDLANYLLAKLQELGYKDIKKLEERKNLICQLKEQHLKEQRSPKVEVALEQLQIRDLSEEPAEDEGIPRCTIS
jgi:hypothetical protein